MNSSSGLKFFSSPKLPSSIYTVVVDVVARKKKEKKWGHLLFFALDPPFSNSDIVAVFLFFFLS